MAAEGTPEFDFTWTIRLAAAAFGILMVAWLGTATWLQPDQPRWLVLVGAVAIAIGMMVYARIWWTRLVRRATLDEHRLRVVTASGREHVIDRADIVVRGLGHGGSPDALARLHHPGGALYVLQPPGADLVDRLLEPVPGR
jgi:hypothetical protein